MSLSRPTRAVPRAVQHNVDYHEEFTVWLKDRQKRPCFGTKEKDAAARHARSDLHTETKLRVIALLNVLRVAKIPLDAGAMTYNAKCARSKAFHIKYAMPPEAYISKFCSKYELDLQPRSQLQQTLEERFRKDYYGDCLRTVQRHRELGTGVLVSASSGDKLVRAPDHELLNTGPVVLYNSAPLSCADLTDNMISEFERAVVDAFGDVWFSVCFYATTDVPQSAPLPENTWICIGAKIDETKFIQIVQPSKEVETQFTAKYEYVPPKRQYHAAQQHRGNPKKRKSSNFT